MTRLVGVARRHPVVALVLLALLAVPLGLLVAETAPPDPGVRQLALSWQRTPGPVLNTGVNAEGQTLPQWTRGTNAAGVTLEAWTIAGHAADTWVADARTRRRPEDWRPVETRTVRAGTNMYILRYQEFTRKLAEPEIQRILYCGESVTGAASYDLGAIKPPKLSSGPAVFNHATLIPANILPPGVDAMACEYRARADFIQSPVRTSTMYFPGVRVTVIR